MASICRTKRDIDNREGHWKVREVSYVVPKFNELGSTNGLKLDQSFTHPHYFVLSQSIAHLLH